MRRGEIWTIAGGAGYAGKPRPAVIVQDDSFDATASVTICAFTTDATEADLFRIPIEPSEHNGLRSASRLMVDKLTTVPRSKMGSLIGQLNDEDVLRLTARSWSSWVLPDQRGLRLQEAAAQVGSV